jgi:hypothetical protein
LYTSVSEVPVLKRALSLTNEPTSHDPQPYERPAGAAETHSMLCLNVTVFMELAAEMVYSALPAAALHVPEMTPVVVSMERPAGSEGDTEYVRAMRQLLVPVAVHASSRLVVQVSVSE